MTNAVTELLPFGSRLVENQLNAFKVDDVGGYVWPFRHGICNVAADTCRPFSSITASVSHTDGMIP